MHLIKPFITWLGRLSVSRKLTLIYLLDLTTVIFISGILIHEKYLSIDFTRKEIIGVAYSDSVRDVLLPNLITVQLQSAQTRSALARFDQQREAHDADLTSAMAADALMVAWQGFSAAPVAQAVRSKVISEARTLLTTVANPR